MAVKLTSTYFKIRELTKRHRVIQGGMSSSKTFSILTSLLQEAVEIEGTRITVLTSTYPLLKDGPISDFRAICAAAGIDFDKYYIKSEKNFHLWNGSVVQFRNLDQLNTHAGKGARRDILFVNEANRVKLAALDQLITRTDRYIIYDFNPDFEFWIHTEYLKPNRDDVDFLVVTFRDNELIPAGELDVIQRRIKAASVPGSAANLQNWVRIYANGEVGTYSERQIYSYEFADEIPGDAKRIFSALDFGLSPDPTTLIDLYIKADDLFVDEVFTENNLMVEKLPGVNRMSVVDKMEEVKFPKGQLVFGDSANKRNIEDLRKHGFNVLPVEKYTGSIIDGIKIIRGYNLKLTRRSSGIARGCESWFFKTDDNDKIIPEPDGHEPDQLAAIRYSMIMFNRKKAFVV